MCVCVCVCVCVCDLGANIKINKTDEKQASLVQNPQGDYHVAFNLFIIIFNNFTYPPRAFGFFVGL